METSESPLGTVRQLQKQYLVARVTGVNIWIIHWFYGSMQVLCSQRCAFTVGVMEELEWFKVRRQGCKSRVCAGLGVSVNPLSLSSVLHKAGAALPPAQSPEEKMGPTGLCRFVGGWQFGSQQSCGIGGCWGQVGTATHCLAMFLNLPGCPLPHL